MQTVLEQGSIDKPLTFDVGLIQLSFIPVCSLNTCNISVKLCRGFGALQCFSFRLVLAYRKGSSLGEPTVADSLDEVRRVRKEKQLSTISSVDVGDLVYQLGIRVVNLHQPAIH